MLVSTLKFVCEGGSTGSDLLLILAAAASIGDRLHEYKRKISASAYYQART